jgi:type I restriction enzyme S subunit
MPIFSRELFDEYKSRYNYPKIGEVLISASEQLARAVIFDGRARIFKIATLSGLKTMKTSLKVLVLLLAMRNGNCEGGTIQRLYMKI